MINNSMENGTICEYLRKNEYRRLFKPFKTKSNFYVYDSGTGKVLQCSEEEYIFWENLWNKNSFEYIIEKFTSSPHIIEQLVKEIFEHNLLQLPTLNKFEIEEGGVIDNASNRVEQITLEVTQLCNLACKYCIYQNINGDFRNFDIKKITWDIAKRAIDYAMEHSGENISITFYGGEPLLEFGLIKKCVSYSQRFVGKVISYSMTTNMTLIDDEVVDFLASEKNFSILCSIDGPQNIHDANRKFRNGEGSYLQAIKGLKKLIDAMGEECKDRIALSMVITPPVSKEKLETINNFFDNLKWLPKEIIKNISYEKISSQKEKKHFLEEKRKNYIDPISNWNIQIDKDNFSSQFLLGKMRKVHNRLISKKPIEKFHMNGCCYPAARRLYITVEGDFLLCERIGNSPKVGNVFQGLNYGELINRYIKEYVNKSLPDCAKCWAVHLCSICYLDAYNEQGIDIEKKRIACKRTKLILVDDLRSYFSILESKSYLLKILQ